jgi:hypothetical protein
MPYYNPALDEFGRLRADLMPDTAQGAAPTPLLGPPPPAPEDTASVEQIQQTGPDVQETVKPARLPPPSPVKPVLAGMSSSSVKPSLGYGADLNDDALKAAQGDQAAKLREANGMRAAAMINKAFGGSADMSYANALEGQAGIGVENLLKRRAAKDQETQRSQAERKAQLEAALSDPSTPESAQARQLFLGTEYGQRFANALGEDFGKIPGGRLPGMGEMLKDNVEFLKEANKGGGKGDAEAQKLDAGSDLSKRAQLNFLNAAAATNPQLAEKLAPVVRSASYQEVMARWYPMLSQSAQEDFTAHQKDYDRATTVEAAKIGAGQKTAEKLREDGQQMGDKLKGTGAFFGLYNDIQNLTDKHKGTPPGIGIVPNILSKVGDTIDVDLTGQDAHELRAKAEQLKQSFKNLISGTGVSTREEANLNRISGLLSSKTSFKAGMSALADRYRDVLAHEIFDSFDPRVVAEYQRRNPLARIPGNPRYDGGPESVTAQNPEMPTDQGVQAEYARMLSQIEGRKQPGVQAAAPASRPLHPPPGPPPEIAAPSAPAVTNPPHMTDPSGAKAKTIPGGPPPATKPPPGLPPGGKQGRDGKWYVKGPTGWLLFEGQ